MKHPQITTILCGGLALLLAACGPVQAASTWSANVPNVSTLSSLTTASQSTASTTTVKQAISRPDGWSEESHGEDAVPNYAVVFPDDEVKQLTITISPEEWATMQANMAELFGEKGEQRGGPGGPPPADGEGQGQPPMLPPDGQVPMDGQQPSGPGGPGGPGGGDMTPENPVWVSATIGMDGQTWTNVGLRYKGNSSLRGSWGNDTQKLPFKLDFDEWEDDHPEIKNQRFYGFQQLSLGNNFGDASGMRETVAYDLLESAGLVAANTAFYDLVLDYGEGPVSLGIYTAVEVIDDTVISRAFADDGGNIYEADGRAATLAAGTQDQIEESFQKENNKQSDWSDVERLYTTLHADTRTTDPAAWRSELESIFDVETFLEWLAVSGAMQHWDTYGAMTHNYYLYNNPETDKLTWISWDHNMVLGSGGAPGGGPRSGQPGARGQAGAQAAPVADGAAAQPANQQPAARGMGPGGANVSLDKQSVTESWPLIRFLLDDPVYYAAYVGYVQRTANEIFVPEQLAAKYQAMAALLAPYADRDGTRAELDAAVQELTTRTVERSQAVTDFLKTASAQP